MRIPTQHKDPFWQRIFAGMVLGAIVSWLVFLFTYGVLQEKQVVTIEKQQSQIEELNRSMRIWQEEVRLLNKKNQETLTVQNVRVHVENSSRFEKSSYFAFEIEKSVKEDVADVIAKDVESAFASRKILKRAIENKTYSIDEKQYKLRVTEMVIYTELYIEVTALPVT
ncbi:sporulation protein [Bacillus lacus]|uniref:Sporulation protein n=1 Tax=Metabacillus lacus TaxID=1983721 RepID=A0A7X2IYD5_9BACI|nr:sporulation membrane protein YtrI [Metabacillus lacus]MRX71742.1 sporulation protein [Metabacillus lacus]